MDNLWKYNIALLQLSLSGHPKIHTIAGEDLAHLELQDAEALNSLGREILRRRRGNEVKGAMGSLKHPKSWVHEIAMSIILGYCGEHIMNYNQKLRCISVLGDGHQSMNWSLFTHDKNSIMRRKTINHLARFDPRTCGFGDDIYGVKCREDTVDGRNPAPVGNYWQLWNIVNNELIAW